MGAKEGDSEGKGEYEGEKDPGVTNVTVKDIPYGLQWPGKLQMNPIEPGVDEYIVTGPAELTSGAEALQLATAPGRTSTTSCMPMGNVKSANPRKQKINVITISK